MTSPSPGQIARFLHNQYDPDEEAFLYALVDSKIASLKLQALSEGATLVSQDRW